MSNIHENLQKILHAVWGKDVRQAIHDAIHDCYEDGSAGSTDLIAREEIEELEATKATRIELAEETADRLAEVAVERGRIDNLVTSGTGVTNATKRTETTLFSASVPCFGNVSGNSGYFNLEDAIDNYDYIKIRYNAFGRTGIVDCKPADISASGTIGSSVFHWSEIQPNWETTSLDNPRTVFRHMDFSAVNISSGNTHRLSIDACVFGWNGDATSNGKISDSFIISWDSSKSLYVASGFAGGVYSIIGVKYTDAGVDKDTELTDIRTGADGTVYQTAGGAVRGQIEDITNRLNGIESNFGDEYDSTATYAVGDRRVYGGVWYECNTAISTAEDWTEAHWDKVSFADIIDQVAQNTAGVAENASDIQDLKEDLTLLLPPDESFVPVDISEQSSTAGSGTTSGITWTKNSENNWSASGTASADSHKNIIGQSNQLISRFYKGQVVKVVISTTDPNIKVNVRITRTGIDGYTSVDLNQTAYIKIPVDASSFLLRLKVASGNTVSGTISFSLIGYYDTHIQSTGDSTDRTSYITKMLGYTGSVTLGKGTFYVKNLTLDEGQSISGDGNSTVLRLADDGAYALKLNSYTKVSNLRIIGADEDITIPDSDFEPEEGETDYLEGVTWTDSDGYTKTVFTDSLPAGTYKFKLNATSDNENTSYIFVKFVDQSTYSSSHVVHSFYTDKDELIEKTIKFDAPVKSIWIFAAGNISASSGYSVTINNAELYTITSMFGTRTGILWETPSAKNGVVTNCMIERFDCAGILARDTGGGVDCNLYISDIFVRNCIAGLYIQKNSEFLRVCNNTFVRNFYGILTRGGNTYVSNCGLDANRVGLQVDNEEGSNGGHGSISNCSINHADNNTGYGLIIKGTGRELITNCNFYYAKVKLLSTNGNVISNCGFGSDTGIEIDAGNGRCNMITDCMFRTRANAITVTSGIVKVNNCWTREGNEVVAS